MLKTIQWEINNGSGLLTLNQPPSNKMNKLFFEELKMLTSEVIPASGISSLIIHGSGRHFSSGADIDDLLGAIHFAPDDSKKPVKVPDFLEENRRSFFFFEALDIPVIAAIQGVCIGSALELAMFCHFRICAEGALLALPEVSFNLMPGCGGTQKLQQLAGKNRALELMLDGRNFSPEEALEWGIVDMVVTKKELMNIASSLAQAVSVNYKKEIKEFYLKKFKT